MTVIWYLTLVYLVWFFCVLSLSFFYKKRISLYIVNSLLVLFVAGLTIFAFFIKPNIEWDLYRHYMQINIIRVEGLEAYLAWFPYAFNPITTLLFLAVSKLPTNQFLPAIAVLIQYSIFAYILSSAYKRHKISFNIFALCLLGQLAFCPLLFSLSGIRNTLACAIFALGIQIESNTHQNKWCALACYIIAPLLHSGLWIVIAIRAVLSFKINPLILMISYSTIFFVNFVFSKIPIPFFGFLNEKIEFYFFGDVGLNPSLYFGSVFLFLTIFAWILIIRFCNKKSIILEAEEKKDFRFFSYLILTTLGLLFLPQMLHRMMYQISYMLPLGLPYLIKYTPNKYKLLLTTSFLGGIAYMMLYQVRSLQVVFEFYTAAEIINLLI